MKRSFLPYYLSRAALAVGFSILVFGVGTKALASAAFLFLGMLVYLHSGWFAVDPTRPLAPLRRDERAREIQRQALIAAILVGFLIHAGYRAMPDHLPSAENPGHLALGLAIATYFVVQFTRLARA